MFDSLRDPIVLPQYSKIKHFEGKGNYAISKYYLWPFRPFYRKKLYMIRSLMDKKRIYRNICDVGSGPGIFTYELQRHAIRVKSLENGEHVWSHWRFDLLVCASSLEYIKPIDTTCCKLWKATRPGAQIIVAGPLNNKINRLYFKLIFDRHERHDPVFIRKIVDKYFKVEKYIEGFGVYYAFKGTRRE